MSDALFFGIVIVVACLWLLAGMEAKRAERQGWRPAAREARRARFEN